MRSSRASLGALLAGLAAIVLCVDTWQPWYALHLPSSLLDQVDALSGRLGASGSYLRAGVDYARQSGSIALSAHDVFRAINVELVLIALAVVGVILAGLRAGDRCSPTATAPRWPSSERSRSAWSPTGSSSRRLRWGCSPCGPASGSA